MVFSGVVNGSCLLSSCILAALAILLGSSSAIFSSLKQSLKFFSFFLSSSNKKVDLTLPRSKGFLVVIPFSIDILYN